MFAGVGVLALVATIGLLAGFPQDVGTKLHVTGLRERLGVIRQPGVSRTLLVTTRWATGAYTVYIATFLYATTGIGGSNLSVVLFV
jgi:predicted MFS family arabinose efflux permease